MFILGGLDAWLLQWLVPFSYLNNVEISEKQEQISHKHTATMNGFKFGR